MTQITLYTAEISPYSHRVKLALVEAEANFKEYEINLRHKPDWYASKVNPQNQVPALTYGGPDVPPEDPSPDSIKFAESLILVQFVSDLFPEANLLPEDPVQRARARKFIDAVSIKLTPAIHEFILHGKGYEELLKAIEEIQDLLPAVGTYAVGDQYTIADIATAPFIGRLHLSTTYDVGKFSPGQGAHLAQALSEPKYEKYRAYVRLNMERPSFQATFNAEYIKNYYAKQFHRE